MKRRLLQSRAAQSATFDMTPIIDVVFLLIIFFILVCRFISAESYEVEVPDAIESAQVPDGSMDTIALVTVMQGEEGTVRLAVGSEKLSFEGPQTARLIARAIDDRFAAVKSERPRVCLRCEKQVPFRYTKVVLDGISQSRAEEVQWAVLKSK